MAKAARDTHPFKPAPGREPPHEPDAATPAPTVSLERGVAVLKAKLRTLPNAPGVYRMLDKRGDALYVGKARSLKKRVVAYTQPERLPYRLQRMVAETVTLEVVVTHTEVEALLLESNYIKRFMPRYNVLLRDDKSFPYIRISGDHDFPQILKHRGARTGAGDYFGPFASAGAVKLTLTALQRAFLLRNCTDSMFASRTRPCLQYQIKRCTAPCVGYVTKEQYAEQVREARDFFSGKSRQIQEMLARRMQQASEALDFEAAALFRDRIRGLSHIHAHQDVNVAGLEDADVIAAHQEGGSTCIQVFFFRGGRNYGNRAYFPSHEKNLELPAVLASFIGQFYDNKEPPRAILLSHAPDEQELLAEALALSAGHRVELVVPQRCAKRKVIDQAVNNAREALGRRLAESSSQRKLLDGVAAAFGLDGPLERVEVYDNSHVQGTSAIGAMIVAGPDGLMKNAYRKFNIRATEVAGDDYGMMREVLTRRFARALKEDPDRETSAWPDLVLIDGGLGQLGIAVEVLAELGIDDVPLVAIAKGPDRNAGRERFFMPGREPFSMELRDPVLYFLQRLRDEAHRFAIETHRAKRAKALHRSSLDDIPGIGGKRKKALLMHFGSARAVERAGLADLEAVEGISRATAKKIYAHFHEEG
jgi:excinuclease ABC subunit C